MKISIFHIFLVFFFYSFHEISGKCSMREPPNIMTAPENDDAGFYLTISGNPQSYVSGELYTVSLQGDKTLTKDNKFTDFLLVVEGNESQSDKYGEAGSYQLLGDILTRFSDHCTNTVTQASSVPKSEIQVLWTAPPLGSPCVHFKATVVAESGLWSMDQGRLNLTLCEQKIAEHSTSSSSDSKSPCCACEEAKYEVSFEGLWTKESHPKNYPTSDWLLHFSDIIGASHSSKYKVWEYGGYASKGLTQVAKWGSPRILESELKAESKHIRTIIKARGLWYPNHNGKTFAVFRTDRENHLISLVSMLGPSPDWIVGVSGLELCQANCSWIEKEELYLYPWDAGVDSGISYESPDSDTVPQAPITRISSTYPNDPRGPFYNETGFPLKPLAKLIITRQRLYKKSCLDENDKSELIDDEEFEDTEKEKKDSEDELHLPGCDVRDWSSWSPCSSTCGKGISMRKREFLIPGKAAMMGCEKQLIQKEMCSVSNSQCEGSSALIHGFDDLFSEDFCKTSEWSRWSDCSTTCGKGFKSRNRRFLNRMGRKKCQHVDTIEKEMCESQIETCLSSEDNSLCSVTLWSDWSPCSVSCGNGLKVRTRLYMRSQPQQEINDDCNVTLMEKTECDGLQQKCEFDLTDAKIICSFNKQIGPCRGYFNRWYYDSQASRCVPFVYGGCRGNSNNFKSYEDCSKLCSSLGSSRSMAQKLLMMRSLEFSQKMSMEKDREIKMMMNMKMKDKDGEHQNKEREMEKKMNLESEKPKEIRLNNNERNVENDEENKEIPLDCLMSSWSPWSDCSSTCGSYGFRRKVRAIKIQGVNGGKKCPKKMERKQKCNLPQCSETCLYSSWSEWSSCSASCGNDGISKRKKTLLQLSNIGSCDEESQVEMKFCNLNNCS